MDTVIEEIIENHEVRAIDRGDLVRAIRYNWLRNAVKSSQMTGDRALTYVSVIHTMEPAQWPEMRF